MPRLRNGMAANVIGLAFIKKRFYHRYAPKSKFVTTKVKKFKNDFLAQNFYKDFRQKFCFHFENV